MKMSIGFVWSVQWIFLVLTPRRITHIIFRVLGLRRSFFPPSLSVRMTFLLIYQFEIGQKRASGGPRVPGPIRGYYRCTLNSFSHVFGPSHPKTDSFSFARLSGKQEGYRTQQGCWLGWRSRYYRYCELKELSVAWSCTISTFRPFFSRTLAITRAINTAFGATVSRWCIRPKG